MNCSTCRHWQKMMLPTRFRSAGHCMRINLKSMDSLAWTNLHERMLITRPEFGCALWEQKGQRGEKEGA